MQGGKEKGKRKKFKILCKNTATFIISTSNIYLNGISLNESMLKDF